MINRRQQRRYPKRYETHYISNNVIFRGFSSDFSLSGLFVRTNRPLIPDTMVDIRVHLPDGSFSKVTGIVRRSLKTSRQKIVERMVMEKKMLELVARGRKLKGREITGREAQEIQEINGIERKIRARPVKNELNGMGIEIIKKDVNYLHLIRSLLA